MKKLLIVVDYQKDFVDGSLGFPAAPALDAGICRKIEAYRRAGDQIAFTYDTHQADYAATQEGRCLPIPHCLKQSPGWELYGQTAQMKEPGDLVFEKPCFGSVKLLEHLRQTPYEQIELVGVVTNICVISNAVLAKTAQPETPVVVDAALCASNDAALHQKALDIMAGLQCRVINR